MNISIIKSKYSAHTELYNQIKEAISTNDIPVRFPITHEIVTNLANSISNIFVALLKQAEEGNLYSSFILYRPLLEHFLKGMYIMHKMAKDKNDETAEKYKVHYLISEFLAEKAGVLDMEDLLNNNQARTDFLKFLTSSYPNLQGFDKANQQEISAAIKQFNLKEIVKYLHEEYKSIPELQSTKIIAQTLPEYSRTSTFTHGGPYASLLMDKYKRENMEQNQLLKILQTALTATGVMKENSFMTYEIDNSFKPLLDKMHFVRS